MIPVRIEGAHAQFVAKNKDVCSVRARKDGRFWVTLWEPSEIEAKLLGAGGRIELWIDGAVGHPAVQLRVAPLAEGEMA